MKPSEEFIDYMEDERDEMEKADITGLKLAFCVAAIFLFIAAALYTFRLLSRISPRTNMIDIAEVAIIIAVAYVSYLLVMIIWRKLWLMITNAAINKWGDENSQR